MTGAYGGLFGRLVAAAVLVVVAVWLVVVAVTPLTLGFGWVSGETNLRSFSHVRQTYRQGFDDARALDNIARNACLAKQAVADARKRGDSTAVDQRESQLLAQEQRYNAVKGEYDAYMQDHFRGKLIHPRGLPIPYPTLERKMAEVCS